MGTPTPLKCSAGLCGRATGNPKRASAACSRKYCRGCCITTGNNVDCPQHHSQDVSTPSTPTVATTSTPCGVDLSLNDTLASLSTQSPLSIPVTPSRPPRREYAQNLDPVHADKLQEIDFFRSPSTPNQHERRALQASINHIIHISFYLQNNASPLDLEVAVPSATWPFWKPISTSLAKVPGLTESLEWYGCLRGDTWITTDVAQKVKVPGERFHIRPVSVTSCNIPPGPATRSAASDITVDADYASSRSPSIEIGDISKVKQSESYYPEETPRPLKRPRAPLITVQEPTLLLTSKKNSEVPGIKFNYNYPYNLQNAPSTDRADFPLKYACDMHHGFVQIQQLQNDSAVKLEAEELFGKIFPGRKWVAPTFSVHFNSWKEAMIIEDTNAQPHKVLVDAVQAGHSSTSGKWAKDLSLMLENSVIDIICTSETLNLDALTSIIQAHHQAPHQTQNIDKRGTRSTRSSKLKLRSVTEALKVIDSLQIPISWTWIRAQSGDLTAVEVILISECTVKIPVEFASSVDESGATSHSCTSPASLSRGLGELGTASYGTVYSMLTPGPMTHFLSNISETVLPWAADCTYFKPRTHPAEAGQIVIANSILGTVVVLDIDLPVFRNDEWNWFITLKDFSGSKLEATLQNISDSIHKSGISTFHIYAGVDVYFSGSSFVASSHHHLLEVTHPGNVFTFSRAPFPILPLSYIKSSGFPSNLAFLIVAPILLLQIHANAPETPPNSELQDCGSSISTDVLSPQSWHGIGFDTPESPLESPMADIPDTSPHIVPLHEKDSHTAYKPVSSSVSSDSTDPPSCRSDSTHGSQSKNAHGNLTGRNKKNHIPYPHSEDSGSGSSNSFTDASSPNPNNGKTGIPYRPRSDSKSSSGVSFTAEALDLTNQKIGFPYQPRSDSKCGSDNSLAEAEASYLTNSRIGIPYRPRSDSESSSDGSLADAGASNLDNQKTSESSAGDSLTDTEASDPGHPLLLSDMRRSHKVTKPHPPKSGSGKHPTKASLVKASKKIAVVSAQIKWLQEAWEADPIVQQLRAYSPTTHHLFHTLCSMVLKVDDIITGCQKPTIQYAHSNHLPLPSTQIQGRKIALADFQTLFNRGETWIRSARNLAPTIRATKNTPLFKKFTGDKKTTYGLPRLQGVLKQCAAIL
ncbi:hypothetical protein C8J55DRAFT_565195 [Lentinula edodes]|uniref:Uncharacterized protein n=1 Tax=Lentinula lateritia TaxID=40482 RepID=A0A9W9DFC8_9AGAR|nr:hypothetical protein C8J55DRAFT_565195 [Lentinula edodes]